MLPHPPFRFGGLLEWTVKGTCLPALFAKERGRRGLGGQWDCTGTGEVRGQIIPTGQAPAVLPRDSLDWFFPTYTSLHLIPEKHGATYQTSFHKSHKFGQRWKPNPSRRQSPSLWKALSTPAVPARVLHLPQRNWSHDLCFHNTHHQRQQCTERMKLDSGTWVSWLGSQLHQWVAPWPWSRLQPPDTCFLICTMGLLAASARKPVWRLS